MGGPLADTVAVLSAQVTSMKAELAQVASLKADLAQLKGRMDRMEGVATSPAAVVEVAQPAAVEVAQPVVASREEGAVAPDSWEVQGNIPSNYQLKPSVWDAALLVGVRGVGSLGSCLLFLALLANIFASLVFFVVLSDSPGNFLDGSSAATSPEAMQQWRETIAHDISRADVVRQRSLAVRVCALDSSLSVADGQKEAVRQIHAWLEPLGVDGTVPLMCGPTLVFLVICIWFLNTFSEVLDVCSFMRAVWRLPLGPRTHIAVEEDGSYELQSVHVARKAVAIAVGLIRLTVVVALLGLGSQWLADTQSLENIVLNSAALICLKIDELLFQSLAPIPAQRLLESMRPLPLPRRRTFKGAGFNSVATLVCMLAVAMAFQLTTVQRNTETMRLVNETLCGGDREFVFHNHPQLGVYSWATPSHDEVSTADYSREVVREIIARDVTQTNCYVDNPATPKSILECGFAALRERQQRSAGELASILPCSDADLTEPSFMSPEKSWLLNTRPDSKEGTTTCGDLQDSCNEQDEYLLRMLCPETCGCHSSLSGLLFTEGCSSACQRMDSYQLELHRIPCKDRPTESLRQDPGWRRYWQAVFKEVLSKSISVSPDDWESYASRGCDLIAELEAQPVVCSDGSIAASLSFWCPEACGCPLHGLNCPHSCGNITA